MSAFWWYFSQRPTRGNIITWHPFLAQDTQRLEAALTDPSSRDLDSELVVHDETGQRLSKVNFEKMDIKPVYWNEFSMPVRRAIWVQLKGDRGEEGCEPLAVELDELVEKAWNDNEKAQDDDNEKGSDARDVGHEIKLKEDCSLILSRGKPSATLLYKDEEFQLVRSYQEYYKHMKEFSSLFPIVSPTGDSSPPKAPKHLVFVVHGIGELFNQRLGASFIVSYKSLRDRTMAALCQYGVSDKDVLMLPISWREGLKLAVEAYFPETNDLDDTVEEILGRITINTIPAVRRVVSDVGLDVLLYMTPAFFKIIIERTLKDLHSSYATFLKAGGSGAKETEVSIIGHSLGGAIVSDLISFVAPDTLPSTLAKHAQGVTSNLGFTVDRFFAVGSQVGLFFLLKQLKPIGCIDDIHEIGKTSKDEDLSRAPYPSMVGSELKPGERNLVFACREMYNIYHPCDPLAFRFEPLVVPATEMGPLERPVYLPYNKVGAEYLKEKIKEGLEDLKGKFGSFAMNLPEWMRSSKESLNPVDIDRSKPADSDKPKSVDIDRSKSADSDQPIPTHPRLKKFNHHGRVDFSIEEDFFANEYVAALTSHFYWEDENFATFLAVEVASIDTKNVKKQ